MTGTTTRNPNWRAHEVFSTPDTLNRPLWSIKPWVQSPEFQSFFVRTCIGLDFLVLIPTITTRKSSLFFDMHGLAIQNMNESLQATLILSFAFFTLFTSYQAIEVRERANYLRYVNIVVLLLTESWIVNHPWWVNVSRFSSWFMRCDIQGSVMDALIIYQMQCVNWGMFARLRSNSPAIVTVKPPF